MIVLEWLKDKDIHCNYSLPIEYAASVDNILALEWIKINYTAFYCICGYDGIKRGLEKSGCGKTVGAKWLYENKEMLDKK